ncbi:hypothetical protein FVE85_5913 [Porphyridium purpureum]|uniref:Uncharacterized protein n=1 Tax=Porphyridium purpureum TaxID=35688 RepID=A0A5J4Z543_PORPP|nr:hypothetical protein FVE85_5913 [Porphyridium purpureum]|eukprot:POR5771..scf295_1
MWLKERELVELVRATEATRSRAYAMMELALRESIRRMELAGDGNDVEDQEYKRMIEQFGLEMQASRETLDMVILDLAEHTELLEPIKKLRSLEDEKLVATVSLHALKRALALADIQIRSGNGSDNPRPMIEISVEKLREREMELCRNIEALIVNIRDEHDCISEVLAEQELRAEQE